MEVEIITNHSSNKFHAVRKSNPNRGNLQTTIVTMKHAEGLGLDPCPTCFPDREVWNERN